MAKKRIQTLLPFALIAIVIAITLVFALRAPSARSEESATPTNVAPYSMPVRYISAKDQTGFSAPTESDVRLRDLPPLPYPLGTGQRLNPDGTVQPYEPSPEMQEKINKLKHRRLPGFGEDEEGD